MEGLDVIRAVVRWVHAIAATAWVGGSVFYLIVLRPALVSASVSNKLLEAAINKGFRDIVDASIALLVLTGVFMTVDRVSSIHLSTLYFIVLGLKLAAVMAMLFMARDLGTKTGRFLRSQRRPAAPASTPQEAHPSPTGSAPWRGALRKWLAPSRMILVLGLAAFFLSMLLTGIYENDLSAGL